MFDLKPTKLVGKDRKGGYVASGYVYDDATDTEHDVVIKFDYTPAAADRPNADLPNPGPGHDAEVDVYSVSHDSDQNEPIDVTQVQFDPVDFMELVDQYSQERTNQDVSWARRLAGL